MAGVGRAVAPLAIAGAGAALGVASIVLTWVLANPTIDSTTDALVELQVLELSRQQAFDALVSYSDNNIHNNSSQCCPQARDLIRATFESIDLGTPRSNFRITTPPDRFSVRFNSAHMIPWDAICETFLELLE